MAKAKKDWVVAEGKSFGLPGRGQVNAGDVVSDELLELSGAKQKLIDLECVVPAKSEKELKADAAQKTKSDAAQAKVDAAKAKEIAEAGNGDAGTPPEIPTE